MGVFHAVDAQTGEPRWTFEAEAEIISSANVAQDRLLFGSYDQFLYCLSVEDGSLVWKLETEGYVHGTPAIVNGAVIVSGCDGYLRIINITDGVEQQKIALGDYVAASPCYSEQPGVCRNVWESGVVCRIGKLRNSLVV